MNIYRVTNGFMGNSAVHVIAVAEDEEQAEELASEQLRQDASRYSGKSAANDNTAPGYRYPAKYWERLECELLGSCDEAFASDVWG